MRNREESSVRRGWKRLAKAIIESGVRANDKEFLQSKWFEFLTDFIGVCDSLEPYKEEQKIDR